jgi:hypothetical protein
MGPGSGNLPQRRRRFKGKKHAEKARLLEDAAND